MKITSDDYFNLMCAVFIFVLALICCFGITKATHLYFIEQAVKYECLKH